MSDFLNQIASLSPKRLALLALELHDELDSIRQAQNEPIAIVGMGCRFPGDADSPEAFWQVLRNGVDTIAEVPPDRWDVHRYYDPDPDTPGKMYSRYGGFLSHVDRFDAPFFGIAPREAAQMDPQQRLLLEVAWEAIEHAGESPQALSGTKTGIFVGLCAYDYSLLQLADTSRIEAHTSSGASPSILANRLSYLLDVRGPSLTVDTACSSSLVTVHLACQSLRQKECDAALAGGVNLMLSPVASIALSKGRMLAADGRCKTFDAAADGYVRGEGCGVVLLKRVSDAVANGDSIRALIRGSAVNQDGYGNGLTAPNLLAQQAVMRQALENARIKADKIGYVETHGTGTALGDPIEVEALRAVYGAPRRAGQSCVLGSVKANIGHLEGAAGIAGLIKAVLVLQHQAIPPHLHFKRLNPHIVLEGTPFSIPTKLFPWPAKSETRCAAVSSFGFGGTNAHIILSEAQAQAPAEDSVERPLHILALSAKSDAALRDLAGRYHQLLGRTQESLADVCFTANAGRSHFSHRVAVLCDSAAAARDGLTAFLTHESSPTHRLKVAFLFTGQGSQYIGMGRRLYETQPVFRAVLNRCDQLLRAHLALPLLSVLYPEPGVDSPLDQTEYTQPALFSIEYALAEMWKSWGISPSAVLGHSVGEYVAACVAGVFSLEDALKVIAARGRLMQTLPENGAMVAVFARETDVVDAIGEFHEEVGLAALNSPSEIVLSGTRIGLQAVEERLHKRGFQSRRLTASHAFHSQLMEPVLNELESILSTICFEEPRLTFISTLTGRSVDKGTLTQARYWRRQARQPVRFAAGVRALAAQGYRVFLEAGPQPVLIEAARLSAAGEENIWLPSLRRGRDDWQQILASLGTFYTRGGSVDWRGFDAGYQRRRVVLPTYPFERQQYRVGHGAPAKHLANSLYELKWEPHALKPAGIENQTGRWLILEDRGGVGRGLAEALKARGASCVVLLPSTGDLSRMLAEATEPWRGVVDLSSLDIDLPDHADGAAMQAAALAPCSNALQLLKALQASATVSRLWMLTRGSQPAGAPLSGLARVIALEHPELRCTSLDIDADASTGQILSALVDELLADDREDQIAWRGGIRYVARLVSLALSPRNPPAIVHAKATYLITGGLGALGLEVARGLVAQGARHLVLVGRNAPSGHAQRVIADLEQKGARVTVQQADVAQIAEIRQVFESLHSTHPALRGIVHAAGALDDGVLLQQTPARFSTVFAPKVAGAWNLHILTQGLRPDFLVFFSSMASLLGTPGQGNYAAANSFLDALSHYRRARGLPAVSINWGPWATVGMASLNDWQQRRRTAQGIHAIEPEEGIQILESLLLSAPPQIGVLPVDWAQLSQSLDPDRVPPVLENLVAPRPKISQGPTLRERLLRSPAAKRGELMRSYVRDQAIRVVGLDAAFSLDPHKPLREIGLDSLMVTELARTLSREIERPVAATVVFTHPTVGMLASFLLAEVFPPENANAETPVKDTRRDQLRELVKQLSDSELEAYVSSDSVTPEQTQ